MARWRYITDAYRQALDVEVVPLRHHRNTGTICIFDENAPLPKPTNPPFREGIYVDGVLYERDTIDPGVTFSWKRVDKMYV